LSQAKNEKVTGWSANVFGLRWSTKLLALMKCAARSSYFVMQPGKGFSGLQVSRAPGSIVVSCLIVRQQTWQKIINSVVAAGL
jgi:hypothetical protein